MAQSTAGIKLYYGTSVGGAEPASWTQIPDVKSIPAMGSAPNKLDTTTLDNLINKTSIPGLQELDSLEFSANMTPELVTAVDTAAAIATCAFKVSFPSPLSLGYWWPGTIQEVRPGESAVDAVVETTLFVSVEGDITKLDESAVS